MTVETRFLNYFSKAEAFQGKNLLQQSVLKVYVEKLIDFDNTFLKTLNKETLNIVALEKELGTSLQILMNGKSTEVFIMGKADRIDRVGNTLRIIDYKSSVNQKDKFEFSNFEDLFSGKNYDKMLQLFLYAWLVYKNGLAQPAELKPCIIPFKKFEKQPKFIQQNKQALVFTKELLQEFEMNLISFIVGIMDMNKPFVQTDDEDVCEYCDYKRICVR